MLKADKGGATVIMKKFDYNEIFLDHLNNSGCYKKHNKNPLKIISKNVCNLIKISKIQDNKNLLVNNPYTLRIYGAPKIHKEGIPLRPIVNTIGGPTYHLAKHLAKKPKPLVGNTDSFVKDSTQFIAEIKNIKLDQNDILVSFNVTSLNTNISIDDAMEVILKLIDPDISKLIEICLRSTFFSFMGEFYEQTCGVAMGSPLSPIVANLFMEDFEAKALMTSTLKPKLWKRFVDDTFIRWPHGRETLETFKQHLNCFSSSIKFTMEVEVNNSLPFLDILFTRNADGSISHQVY